MSNKYHLNDKGEAKPCKSKQGRCPFGREDAHFSTPEDARAFYERSEELSAYEKRMGEYGMDKAPMDREDDAWETGYESFGDAVRTELDERGFSGSINDFLRTAPQEEFDEVLDEAWEYVKRSYGD